MERAIMCPQCGGPLAPHRLARAIVCPFCNATIRLDAGSISAQRFHEAFRVWNSPDSYSITSWVSIGNNHWAIGDHIARGDMSDVYAAQRARWPTELAILKVLCDSQDAELFENEWNALQLLHQSEARGADVFSTLLPQPIMHDTATAGSFTGQRISIYRWESGFHYTFEQVAQAYRQGIPPRASIWMWRRILEVLSFIHASGMAHGAVLPSHLLVQKNDHGVRLVGFSCAGKVGSKLRAVSPGYQAIYPQSMKSLSAQLDIIMSARCIAAVLGGNPATASVPSAVPAPLATVIQSVGLAKTADAVPDAWTLRQQLGQIATQVFGPAQFIPIQMPY